MGHHILPLIGLVSGAALTGIGLVAAFSRPDPSTTYGGERLFDNILGWAIAAPALLIGALVLWLALRALR